MIIIPGTSLPALSNPGAASDLKNGKQLIDSNGNVITGSMPNVSAASPSISVSTDGLITASYTQEEGYIAGTTKNATKQLTTQAGTTITPGTTQKTACASGRYTTGNIYVAGDRDLKAENIRSGVNIFGVVGNMASTETIIMGLQKGDVSRYGTSGMNYIYRIPYTSTRPNPSSGSWILAHFTVLISGSTEGIYTGSEFGNAVTMAGSNIYANGGVAITSSTYFEVKLHQYFVEALGSYGSLYIDTASYVVFSTSALFPK